MRVKSLDLFGFKSFATKTTVHFEPGVTAIVGPNGSGKSNIVDSIRWVLGEHNPRDVRAPRLEDVIFNGTDTKAPLSMAEVSLTIGNEQGKLPIGFSEIQITRRVYRSGESECFINHSPCRLKDIQELFLGTGLGGGTYAIIEQDHIDMILSSKPEERRVVFEEASGIARYLTKKQETLRRLDDVEQDLVRVADIAQEVRRQVSALERAAAKARQYKTQWEQLKSWEIRLAVHEIQQGETVHQQLSRQVESLKQQRQTFDANRQQLLTALEACNASVTTVQTRVQEKRTRVIEANSQIEQHASQLSLKMRWLEELGTQRRQLAQEIARLEERAAQLGQQVDRFTGQREMLDSQQQELHAQKTQASDALAAIEAQLADGLKEFERRKGDLFELASDATQRRNALAEIVLRAQQAGAQVTRLQEQQGQLQQRLESLGGRQRQLEQQRAELLRRQETLQSEWTSARQATGQAQSAHRELMGRFNGLREQALSQRAKTQLLEEIWKRHEGFPESTKALIAQAPEGVIGLLADVLDPEPGCEQALEAALGPLVSAIVVRDRDSLLRCQQALTSQQLDGASFIVLSDARSYVSTSQPPMIPDGFLGSLARVVRTDPAHAGLSEYLLGAWLLVEDMTPVMRGVPASGHRWVSKGGERWDGQSWQIGGRRSSAQRRVGRKRQWEEAQAALNAIEREVASGQEACRRAEEQWRSFAAQEERAKQQAEALAASLAKVDGQLGLAQHETTRAQEEWKTYELDYSDVTTRQRELTVLHGSATQAATEAEARQHALEDALKALQAGRDDASQRKQQHLISLAQLETSLASGEQRHDEVVARLSDLQTEQAQATESLAQKRAQDQERAARGTELTQQLDEHRRQITALTDGQAQLQGEADQVAQALQEEERKRDQVMPNVLAVEQELLKVGQSLTEQESQLNERAFRRTRIFERLQEVYRIGETQVLAEGTSQAPMTEDERQALAEQVDKLKAKLGGIGPVNLGSVEEYDELKSRLEFLQTQQQDLIKSRDDLRHSIQQINRTARQQFRETFAKIHQEFVQYFTRLFGGGQAELILIDEDDVLESGIEIIARPPGKRPQSISLLSGGERALTAIALLFALFKVRPSPFCILDEIDAPLDEANVDRFTRALEEFLSLSQFILITHNKKTITKADSLYGVTMEQPGMSKVVSVKLAKAKKVASPAAGDTPSAASTVPPRSLPTEELVPQPQPPVPA